MTIYAKSAAEVQSLADLDTLIYTEAPEVEPEAIPAHESDTMCRVVLGTVARIFEDPAVRADYEAWKARRAAAAAKA